ncbi:MAG: hypothetical protein H0T18_07645 [Chloroflexia bacterium]|nr:hypothetical protein [Chloroflexia bacterium]
MTASTILYQEHWPEDFCAAKFLSHAGPESTLPGSLETMMDRCRRTFCLLLSVLIAGPWLVSSAYAQGPGMLRASPASGA